VERTEARNTFFITTPIYYVNDVPHIGHAYTTIIADAISRFKKKRGVEVFFLTGTDEHGQKVEKTASEKGLKPKELADRVVVRFKDLWKALDIRYDYFIRTTEEFHEKGVQTLFKKLMDQGDIYKGTYEGYYCVSDENYLSEDVPFEEDGSKRCPDCGKKATLLAEESYFFRLSAYQKPLLDYYKANPLCVRPQSRMNEVRSFVSQGLKDLSITRTTVSWGIPVPGDPEHTIYVWFDALHNYLTAVGYQWNEERMDKFWPADVHLIGKDILRFHAIFWPAFLMAAGFSLPRCVFGHGWWLKDEAKMSKSRGNVMDPHIMLDALGPDPLRYFLLREIPIGLDGNFSHEGFIHRVNSDLANDLGNLVQRTLTMIQNYFGGTIPDMDAPESADKELEESFSEVFPRFIEHFEEYAINRALEEVWGYINMVNRYLASSEPWQLAKEEEQRGRLARVLHTAAAAIRTIAAMIYPVMPGSAEKIWSLLGETARLEDFSYADLHFSAMEKGRAMKKPSPLFPRVDLKEFLKEDKPPQPPKKEKPTMDIVTFNEFTRMDLRVAKILEAEKVAGADKLLRLVVDLASEQRQLVAGIAQQYAPEDLIGKKVAIIVNLQPAKIRGVESNGMILAAVDEKDQAILAFYPESTPTGAKIR
jgi:methionyl-tRNA synthetase